MYRRALLLTAATVALMTGPAFAADPDNTDITTKVTTPVATSTADAGAPHDILIETNGSVVVSGPSGGAPVVPAATIDSNNIITNKGTIQFTNVAGAIGVQLDAGFTGALDSVGTIDLSGSGQDKVGILITQPSGSSATTFTGVTLPGATIPTTTPTAIDLEGGSSINIVGDGSTGIKMNSNVTLMGDIDIGGSITVAPTASSSSSSTGNDVGISLAGPMTGNFTIETGGVVTASGAAAQGVIITGPLTGAFVDDGTISALGSLNPSTTTANPDAAVAVLIESNITGGIAIGGPTSTGTTTARATILESGNAPALAIDVAQGATAPLSIGTVIDALNPNFNILNRGQVAASSANANISSTAISLVGNSSFGVDLSSGQGIFNSGVVSAAATTTTQSSTLTTSIGIQIGAFATVPTIVNNGTQSDNGGRIAASVSGTASGVATAIDIQTNGSLIEIDNSGTITAAALTSDPTINSLSAYAIRDETEFGTLTTINNTGTIIASASPLQNGTQVARAVDLSNSDKDVTFTNNGVVTGDVLFGSGNDTLVVEGLTGSKPASLTGNINFGGTNGAGNVDTLTIGGGNAQDSVIGKIQEQGSGLVNLTINSDAQLQLKDDGDTSLQSAITSPNLRVSSMHVANSATLGLTLSEFFNTNSTSFVGKGIVELIGAGSMTLDPQADMNVTFGSFVTGGAGGEPAQFVLLDAPAGMLTLDTAHISQDIDGTVANSKIPFLFTGGVCTYNVAASTIPCSGTEPISPADSELVLNLTPKTVGTGAGQLNLTGYAKEMFPLANAALSSDSALGAAVIGGVTNLAQAQQVYSAFAPDVTGSQRAIAISLTDQATGAVGARQRALRMYAGQDGEATMWGQEFTQTLTVGNAIAAAGYKDTGFGFALGMDGGGPASGRYGAAFTFYSGDTSEKSPRDSKTTSEWYMLTGYTDWRGKGFFFDSQFNVGYGNIDGKRRFDFGGVTRVADGKRAAALASGGVTAGVALTAGGTVIMPQISLDGLTMRQEAFTESNNGATTSQADDGFDLVVHQQYANSLRSFVGVDIRQDLNFGDFYLQPEGRVGYRYDFVDGTEKLKAAFVCSTIAPGGCLAPAFSITGPDPAKGNLIVGGSIATTTGAWSIGLNYDYLRGVGSTVAKDSTSQSGMITLVGRI